MPGKPSKTESVVVYENAAMHQALAETTSPVKESPGPSDISSGPQTCAEEHENLPELGYE